MLGGFGHSASPSLAPITTFANNDSWHDDVSDGPIRATVTLKQSGTTFDAVPAWVIVAPPKFAPPLESIITLYDVLLQVAVDRLGLAPHAKPSFTADIYPLLRRAKRMKWVTAMVAHPEGHEHGDAHEGEDHEDMHGHEGHGDEKPAHATFSDVLPPPGSAAARRAIFEKLRDPVLPQAHDSGESDMPMIWSDLYADGGNQPLTKLQYANMKKWKEGNFTNDWLRRRRPSSQVTPQGLDRAALETCAGAALYPGIEASWLLRDHYGFLEPFRLDPAGLEAGDVTKQLSVPWQADFFDCQQEGELAWWPAQRPDDVFRSPHGEPLKWTRGLVGSAPEMVERWHRLGFVVHNRGSYLESERG